MKTLVATIAIVTALTLPAFAESEIAGSEARGEADGSFNMSMQDQSGLQSFAQAPVPGTGTQTVRTRNGDFLFLPGEITVVDPATMSPESLRSPSGMDGGNRR